MSTIKISQLPAATAPISGTSVLPVVQNNVTVKATVSQLQQVTSVTAYGAVGNGIADDGPAILAAVTASTNVYFPPGTYKITSEIIIPAGRTLSGPGTVLVSQNIYARAFRLSSNCTVDGLTFQGTGTATAVTGAGGQRGVALSSFGTNNVRVLNCKFYSFVSVSLNVDAAIIQFSSCNNMEVSNCYFDTSNDGFFDIDAAYRAGDCIFTENVSYSNSDAFLYIGTVGGEPVGTSEFPNTANHVVTSNIAIKSRWAAPAAGRDRGRHGIICHYSGGSTYMTASNNIIGNVARHGMYLRGPEPSFATAAGPNIVSSNYFLYCGSGDPALYSSGIRLESTLPTAIIGNYFYKNGYLPTGVAGSAPAYDIECVRGTKDATIADNTLIGAKNGGINLTTVIVNRQINNVKIVNNTIKSSAFGIALQVTTDTIINDLKIMGNQIELTGATSVNNEAAGIVTEINGSATTTVAPYGFEIADNTIIGTGKTQNQWGISLQVDVVIQTKMIVRDNTLRSLEYGIGTYRFFAPSASYPTHRQIGTTLQIIRNRFISCGTAFYVTKTSVDDLVLLDDSNIYEDNTTGTPATSFGPSPMAGNYIGIDGSGNKLVQFKGAVPSALQYYQGDKVIDSSPTAASFIGSVCVASGTPGTWKTYGEISA